MKVGFVSLGCPKNLVDSEVMLGLAQQAGHELTPDPSEAEVLVVNTCAFIDRAKKESIDAILEMAELKKTGACRRLVVTGCLAERHRQTLQHEIPEIDALLGTGEVPDILQAIGNGGTPSGLDSAAAHVPMTFYRGVAPEIVPPPALPTYIYDADTPRTLTTPGHFAYVKVAEGCDYKCAFCIIPTLRGTYRSRPADSILREARALADRGVKEIILISQDTTFYGIDRRERGALGRLLRELNRIDGIEWVRLLYLYPTTIDADTIDAIGVSEKICKYIDLPLQHASDRVLRRMKRPGTRRSYEQLLGGLRERLPGVTLRTTFIVGFPGETEADFGELCAFVSSVEFDHLGVFTYSHEEGTTAYDLEDDVPQALKRRRQRQLMNLQRQIVRRTQKRRVGTTARILIDGPSLEHDLVLCGRLEGQAPEVDPCVYLSDCDPSTYRPGDFITARIVGARDYDLIARPLP